VKCKHRVSVTKLIGCSSRTRVQSSSVQFFCCEPALTVLNTHFAMHDVVFVCVKRNAYWHFKSNYPIILPICATLSFTRDLSRPICAIFIRRSCIFNRPQIFSYSLSVKLYASAGLIAVESWHIGVSMGRPRFSTPCEVGSGLCAPFTPHDQTRRSGRVSLSRAMCCE